MSEFVPFEIAKKLKEKGFDWETNNVYEKNILACRYEDYPKPTISQVLKWLREEKKIFIAINIAWCYEDENKPFYKNPKMLPILKGYNAGIYNLDNLNDGKMSNKITYFETYEEAALAGIEYVLDNLI